MAQTQKHFEYAAILTSKIAEIFDEESEFYIDQKEFQEGDNLTCFFHALANIMPNHLFNHITGEDKDILEFNHLANHLVFQYSNKEEDK